MKLIAQRPSQKLVDLVGTLGGNWHGHSAMCRCPAHADNTPSLSLRQGNNDILVHCFAGCDPGDVLRALGRIVLTGRYEHPPAPASMSSSNVERLWQAAGEIGGTLAERYLVGRRLDLPLRSLRFLARCPLGPKPRTVFKPALLVAVHEGQRLTAIQRIFLDPATAGYSVKMMLGSPAAGAWQGSPAASILGLAEGFEDAVAFTKLTGIPCWAALGAGRLHLVRYPGGVREVVIAEDNDAEGRRAANRTSEILGGLGVAVSRRPPPDRFRDWAKVLEAN